jgi:hypothetical protein
LSGPELQRLLALPDLVARSNSSALSPSSQAINIKPVPTTCGSRLPIDAFLFEKHPPPYSSRSPPRSGHCPGRGERRLGRSTPCGVPAEGARSKRKTPSASPLQGSGVCALVPHQPRCASSPSSSSAHEVEWAEVTQKLRVIVPISVKILLLQYTPKKFMRTAGTSSESNRSIVFLGPAPKRPAAQSYPKCACFVVRLPSREVCGGTGARGSGPAARMPLCQRADSTTLGENETNSKQSEC